MAFVAELGVGHFSRRADTRAELYVERGTNLMTCKIGASPVSRMSSGTTRPGARYALGESTAPGAGTTIGAVGVSSHLIGDSHTVPANVHFGGTAQYVDVTAYGARALSGAPPQTTVTVRGGSTAAALAATGTFRNGDGVVIYGAGATNTMSTPSAPTVVASAASSLMFTGRTVTGANVTGSTSYDYVIEARDQNGGITAASSETSISNGVATLGTTTGAITSSARAGNTVTVTMSAPFTPVVGTMVYILNGSDPSFSGYYQIAGSPDSSHFTYVQGTNSNGGAGTSSTGGSAVMYLCNHISWTAVTGAWQYYIYGRTSGSLAYIGASRPGELYFDDYGSGATSHLTKPSYVTSTPQVAATNDYLSTTIVSGAGTTAVTIANPTVNTVAGSTFLFDDAPGILAAVAAAQAVGGTVHFPKFVGSYVINSFLNLGQGISISQDAGITINETVEIGQSTTWRGSPPSSIAPQFAYSAGSQINANAYPSIFETDANSVHFEHLTFGVPTQGLGMMLGGGTFNATFDYVNFIVSCCNGFDYTGMGFYSIGINEVIFRHSAFTQSPPGGAGNTNTPIAFFRDTGSGGIGHIEFKDCTESGRGISVDSASASAIYVTNMYAQALQSSMFTVYLTAFGNPTVHFDNNNSDTSNQPLFVLFGAGANLIWEGNGGAQAEAGGFPGSINGKVTVDIRGGQNTGINARGFSHVNYNAMRIPFWDPSQAGQALTQSEIRVDSAMHFPSQYTAYWDLQPPSNIAAAPVAGGTTPDGTYWLTVTATGYDGGETVPGTAASCTTSSGTGNSTCVVTWNALEGAAAYTVYAGSTAGGAGHTNAQGCLQIAALICTIAHVNLSGGQSSPSVSGTGLTTIMSGRVITPIFQCNAFVTVASLPAASASKGLWTCVGDSTAIVTEGQPAVGGSTHVAAVFSDGTQWKAF